MDPASHQTSSFEMPSPTKQGEVSAAAPERAGMQEGVPTVQPAAPASAPPSVPIDPALYAASGHGSVMPAPASSTPAVADDLDLIEKEWVEKAKAIVAQTRNDPRAQNNQMNHFKADYMKKRYNKDIKLPEGS